MRFGLYFPSFKNTNKYVKSETGVEITNAKVVCRYIPLSEGENKNYVVYQFDETPVDFLSKDYSLDICHFYRNEPLTFKYGPISEDDQKSFNKIYSEYRHVKDKYKVDYSKKCRYLFYKNKKFIYVYESNLLFVYF